MATLAESFMADLADLSDDSAGSDDEQQEQDDTIDGADLLVGPIEGPAIGAQMLRYLPMF